MNSTSNITSRLRDPHTFHIPSDPHGSSGSLRADVWRHGFHHSSSVLYEHPTAPTAAAQGLGVPHGFRNPAAQGLQDMRFRDPQSPADTRLSSSHQYAVHHDSQGFFVRRPRRVSDSHEYRGSARGLDDPREIRRSWASVGGRLRPADRQMYRSDDLHRPHSNLAATSAALSDAGSSRTADPQGIGGRVTSMSVGSLDSVQRPLVKFCSLPGLDVIRRQTRSSTDGTNSAASCAGSAVFDPRCLERTSTFVSMPCISAHQRTAAGRGLATKRFLPTLSISEEVSQCRPLIARAYRRDDVFITNISRSSQWFLRPRRLSN